jgi:hypothetical protein
MALAIAAPTTPSTIFISIPILLFMNCSASQPAIPPMMAAIQPTSASAVMTRLLNAKCCSVTGLARSAKAAPLFKVDQMALTRQLNSREAVL